MLVMATPHGLLLMFRTTEELERIVAELVARLERVHAEGIPPPYLYAEFAVVPAPEAEEILEAMRQDLDATRRKAEEAVPLEEAGPVEEA